MGRVTDPTFWKVWKTFIAWPAAKARPIKSNSSKSAIRSSTRER